jgi:hypothetical protein
MRTMSADWNSLKLPLQGERTRAATIFRGEGSFFDSVQEQSSL